MNLITCVKYFYSFLNNSKNPWYYASSFTFLTSIGLKYHEQNHLQLNPKTCIRPKVFPLLFPSRCMHLFHDHLAY